MYEPESGSLYLDGIVIETTDLADSTPVAQAFFMDNRVKSRFMIDDIITDVDAKHIEQYLGLTVWRTK